VNPSQRFVLTELRERPHMTRDIAAASSISEGEVLLVLQDLNDRIRAMFPERKDPITANAEGTWKADGIAGLVRLNPSVELEIVPKFLNSTDSTWRQDFFVLAVLVKTGHLLQQEEIAATTADRDDLATLVAWSLLALCDENSRRPLRSYIPTKGYDFALEGDVDPESILMPDSDGYQVTRLELTNRNPYNATISAAARILQSEVGDVDTQNRLHHLVRSLNQQDAPPRSHRPLAQRHHGWADAYNLSRLIVDGLGLNLNDGTFTGPGFVISTWEAWESFCEEVMRRALPNHRVQSQRAWGLGSRGDKPVETKPDLSVLQDGRAVFLLDAKYKTRAGKKPAISSTDVYESFAFLHAADVDRMDLLYPSTESTSKLSLGEWFQFDDVKLISEKHVRGMAIQIQGLSQRGGIERIVARARAALTDNQ
jgi:5-methylcytosine-specific restriction enzyme subunit McrC